MPVTERIRRRFGRKSPEHLLLCLYHRREGKRVKEGRRNGRKVSDGANEKARNNVMEIGRKEKNAKGKISDGEKNSEKVSNAQSDRNSTQNRTNLTVSLTVSLTF
jgi:hypothetical protein